MNEKKENNLIEQDLHLTSHLSPKLVSSDCTCTKYERIHLEIISFQKPFIFDIQKQFFWQKLLWEIISSTCLVPKADVSDQYVLEKGRALARPHRARA